MHSAKERERDRDGGGGGGQEVCPAYSAVITGEKERERERQGSRKKEWQLMHWTLYKQESSSSVCEWVRRQYYLTDVSSRR